MPHYWLKYKISSRGSVGAWQWEPLGSHKSKKEVSGLEDILDGIRERECWGESHRLRWTIEDWVPSRVLAQLLHDAEESSRRAMDMANHYSLLLSAGVGKECPQCKDAEAYNYKASDTRQRRTRACPTCGRDVFEDSLPYLIPVDQKNALKLLDILVRGEEQTDSKWPSWARDSHDGETVSPLQWLIDLGLGGGHSSSSTNFKTLWCATEKGKAEWEKQKHLLKSKKTSGRKG